MTSPANPLNPSPADDQGLTPTGGATWRGMTALAHPKLVFKPGVYALRAPITVPSDGVVVLEDDHQHDESATTGIPTKHYTVEPHYEEWTARRFGRSKLKRSWWATIRELPGCYIIADSLSELRAMTREHIRFYTEDEESTLVVTGWESADLGVP